MVVMGQKLDDGGLKSAWKVGGKARIGDLEINGKKAESRKEYI